MLKLISKILVSKHEKDVKRLRPTVDEINRHVAEYQSLTDEQLKGKTAEFRERIHQATAEIEKEIADLKAQLRPKEEGDGEELSLEKREEIYIQIEEKEAGLDEQIKSVLDELLPEAFAVVKDACRRLVGQSWEITGHKVVWDMVPFDVQLMGAAVLHEGKIAEMATGEG